MAQSRLSPSDVMTTAGIDEYIQNYIPLSTLGFFPVVSKEFNAIEQEANIKKKRMAELTAKLQPLDRQSLEQEGIKSEDAAIVILKNKSICDKFESYVPPVEVDAPSSSSVTVHYDFATLTNHDSLVSAGGIFKLGKAHSFAGKLILGNGQISSKLSPAERKNLQNSLNPAKPKELDYSRFMY